MTKVDNDGSFADTAMGAILGGGLFVTSIVAGLITFFYSMGIRLWVFLRDTLFYLGAIIWLVVMIADGEISLAEALGFVGFYVCYVVLVIVSLKFEKGETSKEPLRVLLINSLIFLQLKRRRAFSLRSQTVVQILRILMRRKALTSQSRKVQIKQ